MLFENQAGGHGDIVKDAHDSVMKPVGSAELNVTRFFEHSASLVLLTGQVLQRARR
jgi:hypothetical protein